MGEASGNLALILAQNWSFRNPPKSFVNVGVPKVEGAVVLHPGAYHSSKQWPHFLDLQKRIVTQTGEKVFVFRDQLMSLPDMAATIRSAKLFVGNDSGPSHVAAAVGTPTIIIYGPTPLAKNIPFNRKIVKAITEHRSCSPCYYQGAQKDKCGFACLYMLRVERVFSSVLSILDEGVK